MIDLCIVQVRAIFSVKPRLASYPYLLAYVEYFTKFKDAVHKQTRFYEVSRSKNGGKRQSAVIPLDTLYQSCHLIPKFGQAVPSNWNSSNVIEVCNHFYLNDMIDLSFYQTL
jgi:hypothetical protein